MQLERILQAQGFGTRKVCRALARAGRVAVAGTPCTEPFAEFDPQGLEIDVAGVPWLCRERVYVMLNKPPHYECSSSPRHHPSVLGLLPDPLVTRGIQPVGRLDEDTTGLLLFSDDGAFIHNLISPKRKVEKVYRVGVKHDLNETQIAALLTGVKLHDSPEPVAALACERLSQTMLDITLNEGRYHQVKRMLAAAGNRVVSLERIRIGRLWLPDDLAPGNWRWLEPTELAELGLSPSQPES